MDPNSNANLDTHLDAHGQPYGHAYEQPNLDPHGHANGFPDSHTYRHAYAYRRSYGDQYTYSRHRPEAQAIMETGYTLTFSAFVGIFGIVAWFLVQRQIKKSDDESTKKDLAVEARFKDHEVRMNQHGDRLRNAEIELERKTTREELEKVSDRMTNSLDSLRNEVKTDLQNLQTTVLAAFSRNNHGN